MTVEGSGKDKYMKGSKVIEILPHRGQTSVDLYWPWGIYCRKIKMSCLVKISSVCLNWKFETLSCQALMETQPRELKKITEGCDGKK